MFPYRFDEEGDSSTDERFDDALYCECGYEYYACQCEFDDMDDEYIPEDDYFCDDPECEDCYPANRY